MALVPYVSPREAVGEPISAVLDLFSLRTTFESRLNRDVGGPLLVVRKKKGLLSPKISWRQQPKHLGLTIR
jgi:hypothetical protein